MYALVAGGPWNEQVDGYDSQNGSSGDNEEGS